MKKAIKILESELKYYTDINRSYQESDYLIELDIKISLLKEMIDKLKN